jgi:hypothetical protein
MAQPQPVTGTDDQSPAPKVDVDQLMAGIQDTCCGNRRAGDRTTPVGRLFEDVMCPQEPVGDEHNPLLYYHLREASQSYASLLLDVDIAGSRLDRLPLIGMLWTALRRPLHKVPVYYTRKMAGFLIPFNRHVTNTLNIIVHHDRKQDADMAELRARLAELETRLAQFEGKP